jgi:hypothetical protein
MNKEEELKIYQVGLALRGIKLRSSKCVFEFFPESHPETPHSEEFSHRVFMYHEGDCYIVCMNHVKFVHGWPEIGNPEWEEEIEKEPRFKEGGNNGTRK